jgi:hypothetical protein
VLLPRNQAQEARFCVLPYGDSYSVQRESKLFRTSVRQFVLHAAKGCDFAYFRTEAEGSTLQRYGKKAHTKQVVENIFAFDLGLDAMTLHQHAHALFANPDAPCQKLLGAYVVSRIRP